MSGHRHPDRLGDYVDGSMGPSDRARLELHLASCETCREMVRDLLRIKQAAARLPRRVPSEDVWRRIEDILRSHRGMRERRRSWLPSSRLALAASVVLLIGVYSLLMWWSPFSTTPHTGDSAQLTNYVVSELEKAEQHYVNAISGLERIVQKERQQQTLVPDVMVVLNDNLEIIEKAIEESRAAAQQEPESLVVRESLLDALKDKLALLERTILLINELSKGRGESAYDLLNEMREDKSKSNPI